MSNKRYEIIRTIPNGDVGTIMELSGGFYYPTKKQNSFFLPKEYVENNPFWFSEIKEPERIEVENIFRANVAKDLQSHDVIVVNTNGRIPEEKYPLIKKAIEDVLNYKDEPVRFEVFGEGALTAPKMKFLINGVQVFPSEKYTEDDIKDAIKYTVRNGARFEFPLWQTEALLNQWKSQRK